MKNIFTSLFIFLLININFALADTFINVCKRGPIGLKIKQITGATSCQQVSMKKMSEITSLSLEHEEISSIPDFAFAGLTSVREINLSTNNIKQINPQTFMGLSSLEKLNLSDNYISSFEKDTFRSLSSLKMIDLSYNFVAEVSRSDLGLSEDVIIDGVGVNP